MGGERSEHWREEKGSHPRVTLSSPAGAFEGSGRHEAGQQTAPWALGPSTPAGELRWERGDWQPRQVAQSCGQRCGRHAEAPTPCRGKRRLPQLGRGVQPNGHTAFF